MAVTQRVEAEVTEIYDLQTQAGKSNVLKVITPQLRMVNKHLMGHMLQYRKWKYHGCQVMLVPASTLPADPLQVSYEAGEPTIDPRDMINPILWKHKHGEVDMYGYQRFGNARNLPMDNTDDDSPSLGGLVGMDPDKEPRVDTLWSAYYTAMMDPSWKKAGVQNGLRAMCKPLVYNVASNFQIGPMFRSTEVAASMATNNTMIPGSGVQGGFGEAKTIENEDIGLAFGQRGRNVEVYVDDRAERGIFTNKLERMGWRDTLNNSVMDQMISASSQPGDNTFRSYLAQAFPRVEMMEIIMPPAYKTDFYFRMYIKHYFGFAKHNTAYGPNAPTSYRGPYGDNVGNWVAGVKAIEAMGEKEVSTIGLNDKYTFDPVAEGAQ